MSEKIPYGRHSIGPDEHSVVKQVLDSKWLTQGPLPAEFEEALAALCDAKHAIATRDGGRIVRVKTEHQPAVVPHS